MIVVRKLILPRIEEIPAICRLKIAKSTEIPEWNLDREKGRDGRHAAMKPQCKWAKPRREMQILEQGAW
jgi:hypothetical protein